VRKKFISEKRYQHNIKFEQLSLIKTELRSMATVGIKE
jgi:hypothetical protein